MIKNITSFLDYGIFAEIALAIFASVFVAIVIRTLLTKTDITKRQAQIVLDGQEEEQA